MAERSQRTAARRSERRNLRCVVHEISKAHGPTKAGIAPLQIVIVLDRSHEHYFKFARDPLFQTLKAIDKSISADRKLMQLF